MNDDFLTIYVCSRYSGDCEVYSNFARQYCRAITLAGHLPIAPHIYFTRFLDDNKKEERALGLDFGIKLLAICDELWVFGGPSEGMSKEIKFWREHYDPECIRYLAEADFSGLQKLLTLYKKKGENGEN